MLLKFKKFNHILFLTVICMNDIHNADSSYGFVN